MNDIEKVLENCESKDEMIRLKKWIDAYMVPLDVEQITWLNLTSEELQQFLNENYLDENNNCVHWDNSFMHNNVLGMKYLCFFNAIGFNFLIGVIPNRIGKKTIVASLCYQKNRRWSLDQERPVNSIQTIETNAFYQRQGLFSILVSRFKDCLDWSQDLVITDERDDGVWFHTVDRVRRLLIEQGFSNEILTRSEFDERNKGNNSTK